MGRKTIIALAVLIGLCTASPARATPLPPGTTLPADPLLTAVGTLEASATITETTTVGPHVLSITIVEKVILDSTTHGLDFTYQATSNSASNEPVARLTTSDFTGVGGPGGGLNPNVGYSGAIAPLTMDRSGDGSVIGWNFAGYGGHGSAATSALLIIQTSATAYDTFGSAGVSDGITVSFTGFEPTTSIQSVPEPSTLAIAGIGALGMIGYGLRRRKALGA
jgi:hypothetical protein